MENDSKVTYLGFANFRGQMKKFGIKPDDRRRHLYVIGKTGMGKSELLQNMAIQDIINGHGMAFIDPHGDVAEKLLEFVPQERIKDVIYFNPADTDFPVAFNVMESVDRDKQHLVVAGLMGVFKKIWPDVWSARMEYILNNSMLALLDYPEATLLGINWMFSDIEFREKVISHIKDPVVKNFWTKEYSRYNQRYEVEATAAIQNKIGQFISNPVIRNIIGQTHSTFDIRQAMDERKIIILNLSKGRVGEDNSRLLGAMLVTKLYLAAMSRVDIAEKERQDFYLYVDEFQNFATEAFVNILSEARKYRLCLILAHQYVAQMEEHVRDAVFGNMGTMISFRIGAEDGEHMEKEFSPNFLTEDFVNLPKYNIYLKLMIDGLAGNPFSANTLPPWPKPENTYGLEVIEFSRKKYATPRAIVDQKIKEWAESMKVGEPGQSGGGGGGGGFSNKQMYDGKCASCGKDFKVGFKPDYSRPLYCKDCLKVVLEKRAAKNAGQEGASNGNGNFVSLSNLPFVAPKEGKEAVKGKGALKPVDTDGLKNLIEKAFEKSETEVVEDDNEPIIDEELLEKYKEDFEKISENEHVNDEEEDDDSMSGMLEQGKRIRFK